MSAGPVKTKTPNQTATRTPTKTPTPKPCKDVKLIDFSAYSKGTKIKEQYASWGVHIAADNQGGGPNLAIVFDSAHPTGGDDDLGTPNEDFGGPGIGSGGRAGQPGENSVALDKLLIIAENSTDNDGNGRVDSPDDEEGGGVITFTFDTPLEVIRLFLVDMKTSPPGTVIARNAQNQIIREVGILNLGTNSVQRVDVNAKGVSKLEVVFPGTGALTDVKLCLP
jgi:hypothetical protein